MNWQALFHWLYVAAMAIGALHFWLLSRNPKGVPQYEYLVAIFIPIWSGLAYMAMALDQGKVEAAGQIAHYARYLDWTDRAVSSTFSIWGIPITLSPSRRQRPRYGFRNLR